MIGQRLGVLFEDEHCLAVSKPGGQFTQGSWAPPGERTLEQAVREHLCPADPASAYVGIVHRLDRPVSGVLIWGKNPRAARRLSAQFERRQAAKEYWAIAEVAGSDSPWPSGSCGIWTDWLTPPGVPGVAKVAAEGDEGARLAVTRFQTAEAPGLPVGCLWLRLWPETGRTHQLRVQAAARGLPILGDSTYGASRPFPRAIALHARSLRVRHPILQTPMTLVAPLPTDWADEGCQIIGQALRPDDEFG